MKNENNESEFWLRVLNTEAATWVLGAIGLVFMIVVVAVALVWALVTEGKQ
jgi:hypothetical protein